MKAEILTISEADYHGNKFSKIPAYSNSIGKIIIAQSPKHAWMAHPLLNPDYEPDDNSKFDLGTAAHAALLEGLDVCTIVDADDWRTNAAKDARDEARKAGKIPMLKKDYPALAKMVSAANDAIAGCKDLGGITLADGKSEQTIVWEEGGVLCKARLDWIENGYSLIADYKSTGISNPDAWMRSIVASGYDMQDSFYRRALKAATGEEAKFVFIVQETESPYSCYFVSLPPQYQAVGDEKVRTAMALWSECMKTGVWPSYPNRILYPEIKPWMEAEWVEKRMGIEDSRMMPISEYIAKEGIPL